MKESHTTVETELPQQGGAQAGGVVRAAVAGATGYAGRELLTWLARHPKATISYLASSGRTLIGPGQAEKRPLPIAQSHPSLSARGLPECRPLHVEDFDAGELDVVFLATPHEVSHDIAPQLVERGLRVIDLSGAFRLKDPKTYARWYGFEHEAPEALARAVYGLSELNGEAVRAARLVANPGCYATSVILALAPILRAGWADLGAGIISDSKSGASGAGRAPSEKLHFAEVNENLRAYGVFQHRHVPEMLEALGLAEASFTFTPHLLPITRGILSTLYVRVAGRAKGKGTEDVVALAREFYRNAPLVRVCDAGTLPEISSVANTNFADLGFALDRATGRLIIVSALDNLGKGAAGQAIQNMNLMFGFPEATGLL